MKIFMAGGISSTIDSLQVRLLRRWCPKWRAAFIDPALGGFYERLNRNFKPVLTGQRRLVSQCRQLSVYCEQAARDKTVLPRELRDCFDFIVEHYHDPVSGHWWFSIDDAGAVKDRYSDLYALSFVIFSFSHYFRACGDMRAKKLAEQVLRLISERFRLEDAPGFAEALAADGMFPLKTRRQNPHMHLLEACLFAHDVWGHENAAFLQVADEIVGLFYNHFYDAKHQVVREFFNHDLTPHADEGEKVEPGHSFEWVWLLKKHGRAKGNPALHDAAALALLDRANRFGWDGVYGGIYDVLSPDGIVLTDTKRIWPFCEALKANALMLTVVPDRQALKDRVSDMVDTFKKKYMDERGFWTEWRTREGDAVTDYMPATTPYHVYFGIMETADILNARGRSLSIGGKMSSAIYSGRQAFSSVVRSFKKSLKLSA